MNALNGKLEYWSCPFLLHPPCWLC